MTATTHRDFGPDTEALDVAKAFKEQIRGKTILVTGVNRGGIGFTTAQAFASQAPAHLIITGRNPAKIQESIDAMRSEYPDVDYRPLNLDLSSQKAVRAAAVQVLAWEDIPTIDIVVNSAGIMNLPERTLNEDGIEMHFGTNHIGHFLFVNLIMPKILAAARKNARGATRVVNVTSLSPTVARMRWSDMNFEVANKDLPEAERPPYEMLRQWGTVDVENKKYVPIEAYNQSKVANVLFSVGLNDRLYEQYGILSFAVHPGIVWTESARYVDDATRATIRAFVERLGSKTLGAGSSTSLVAAMDASLGPPRKAAGGKDNLGVYLVDCQISDAAHPLAVSSSEAEKLWEKSEELVGEKFRW
ncbi:uncharacterized protein PV09_04012 [Verruconis gallopava]|uniref:Uncharacterized protein n=1 Tax=Verruconis gallopava TaxID=253628 RepID=A0A0D2B0C4_9PEZI|nr:uncharacterized protein PV09_04012 [Verruconis gallopava]KIW04829.1 hypothetical protein PV09_04012 [Verruconis gallopava]